MKTIVAFVAAACVLAGCCCPCPLPTPSVTATVSPQARAVAEHIVAQATPGEQKF